MNLIRQNLNKNMKEQYKLIHIWDLPKDKFSVNINKIYLDFLFQKNKGKFNNLKGIVKNLHKNCESLKKFTFESCLLRMSKCFKNKYQLPLDCFIELVKMAEEDLKTAEKHIEVLGFKYVKNPLKIKFPVSYDENFAIVSEAIRTEGHIWNNLRKIEIGNMNMDILTIFKNALINKFNIKNKDIKLCLFSYITIPHNFRKDEIKIIDTISGKNINNFCIIKRKLKSGTKKIICIYDYNVLWSQSKEYLIGVLDKQIKCKINIPEKGNIRCSSDFTGYKNTISSCLRLIIGNKTIAKILNHNLKIQAGRKSHKIYLPEILKQSPKPVIKKAFEISFACEGSISKYIVRLRSISKRFLEDWKDILFKKFDINSNITNSDTNLQIIRKKNFKKLLKEFDFIQTKKRKILLKNSQVKDILLNNTADSFYLNIIDSLGGKATNKEIAKKSRKTFVAVKKHLPRLVEKGYLKKQIIGKKGHCIYISKKRFS